MNFKVVQLPVSGYSRAMGGGTYSSMLTSKDHGSAVLALFDKVPVTEPSTTIVIFKEKSS